MMGHNDTVIGMLGVDVSGRITTFLHPDYWGVGLSTEILEQALPIIVKTFDHKTLMADVFATNPHFTRVFSRLSFEKATISPNAATATLEPAPAILYRLSSTAALTA